MIKRPKIRDVKRVTDQNVQW